MMDLLVSKPSPRELREAYARTSPWRKRVAASYDELWDLFQNPELSFVAIGKQLRVSTQAVKKIYRQYFEELFGYSGRERWHILMRIRKDERLRQIPNGRSVMGEVMQKAVDAGLSVQRVPVEGKPTKLSGEVLDIGGTRCQLHVLRHARKRSSRNHRWYVQVIIAKPEMGQSDAHIVFVATTYAPARIFVLPAYVLNKLNWKSTHVRSWIPLEGFPVYKGQVALIDWSKYEAPIAWKFLE